mgnify:CR=1 FL=1
MDLNVRLAKMTKAMKTQLFIDNLTTIFNPQALFSDGTAQYRIPPEPKANESVKLRFRTGRENIDRVVLVVCTDTRIEMKKVYNDRLFDYYESTVELSDKMIDYYFEVTSGTVTVYYNSVGVCSGVEPYYNFTITPSFHTPDWAKGAIFYQIYVDRFYNGDRSNDVEKDEYVYIGEGTDKVTDWFKYPAAMGVREFYGGDIAGVWQKLDYLQELGVDAIYFNPIFVSPSNHKYDIQDYDYIDPHFGKIVKDEGEVLHRDENGNLMCDGTYPNKYATKYVCRVKDKENLEASNLFFAEFVEEVHKRGMKVILDGVFNHCGSFNKWLDRECIYEDAEGYEKGAYISADSPYRTFFRFNEDMWPYNYRYDGWWGHDTLPKLNYEDSPLLFDYIMHIARKWVSPPYNVDGWRLDVAADLGYSPEYNHYFWKRFREEVKKANPDAIILAEHYGDSYEWLQGDQWDTIMNYDAFMEPVTWFLTGMEKHSDEARPDSYGNPDYFFGAMHHNMARMGGQSVAISMNELSNHDHSRFLTRTNRTVGRTNTLGPEAANNNVNKAVFKEAVVMQMTLPGAPTVYYGDEAGVCGFTDPDNRRTYPWGHEDTELIDFHRAAIKMHKENDVLRKGSYKSLYSAYNVVAYGRFTSDDAAIIIVNNNDDEVRARIPAWEVGLGFDDDVEQLLVTFEGGYSTDGLGYHLQNGWLDIGLRKTSAVVLHKMKW